MIFPVWLIILIIIYIIIVNIFIFLKQKPLFSKFFLVSIASTFITLCLLHLPLFIKSHFIYNKISLPLLINQYQSLYSIIYLLSIFIIFIIISSHFLKEKKILIILILPYFIFIPKNILSNPLKSAINVDITNKNIVKCLLKELNYKDYNITLNPNIITINYQGEEFIYQDLEKDASLLFLTLQNLDIVKFIINDATTEFIREDIKNIYNQDIKYQKIEARYQSLPFTKYEYVGNANGYDIFDASSECNTSLEKLYEDENFIYMVSCAAVDKLIINGNIDELLIDSLKNKLIIVDDLYKTHLKIYKEEKK